MPPTEPSRAYLDHAASTPMLPEAVAAMSAQLGRLGNASSLHASGRAARRVVEESRELIAERLGCRPAEVVFTSGGTEADNLAVKGGFWAGSGSSAAKGTPRTRLITTAIEHPAVVESVGWLAAHEGADVAWVDLDRSGTVSVESLETLLQTPTALVSVIWGNNEIGTVQPVAEIAQRARAVGALSHSDAVQAVGHVPLDFAASGLDLLSLAAHKLGGPYGVGALLVRRDVTLPMLQHGGGQERDLRSGTLNVAAIAGFACAVDISVRQQTAEAVRLSRLAASLVTGASALVDGLVVNSAAPRRLPGIVNLTFPGCQADDLLLLLDAVGIDCSVGSACSAGVSEASHVLLGIGAGEQAARSSLRFSLGSTSTGTDIERLLAALPEAVGKARLVSGWRR